MTAEQLIHDRLHLELNDVHLGEKSTFMLPLSKLAPSQQMLSGDNGVEDIDGEPAAFTRALNIDPLCRSLS